MLDMKTELKKVTGKTRAGELHKNLSKEQTTGPCSDLLKNTQTSVCIYFHHVERNIDTRVWAMEQATACPSCSHNKPSNHKRKLIQASQLLTQPMEKEEAPALNLCLGTVHNSNQIIAHHLDDPFIHLTPN
jgi:hypothetical protein